MRGGRLPVKRREEAGFTLIETLVAIFLFSVLSAGFYSAVFSGVRGSDTTESVVRISGEARLGFNRMVRDVREAARIVDVELGPNPNASFTIHVDFDADGSIEASQGEVETFEFDEGAQTILINGEILMAGVRQIGGSPVFDYSSNQLEYDYAPADGVATWQEIDDPPVGITRGGDRDGVLDAPEFPFLSNISFAFTVASGDAATDFYSEAQLRNVRIPRT